MSSATAPAFVFHHTGCVVPSIEQAVDSYRLLARSVGPKIYISSQAVTVCFVEVASGCYIELVEPAGSDSIVAQLLKKRISFYHVAYLTGDLDKAIELLETQGFHHLNTFRSEAFEMNRCAFTASPLAHLVEIIEIPAVPPTGGA